MFPSDLWIADPNADKLYKVENDSISLSVTTPSNPRAVLVSQDMINVYTLNWDENTVSQYRHGVHVLDIKVGNGPRGICEDGNGVIYVTNYTDSTVSKIIVNSSTSAAYVADTISVHTAPYGIVADSRNKIFVACYLSSVVDEIVNDTVVNTVSVGYAPRAITCDVYDNIWVACYGANTVSKLTNAAKVLDIELSSSGRGPIAIVSNSAGTVYTANYLGNNVSIIKDGALSGTISIADAPTSIGINKDDAVYVTSELEGVVSKIVKDKDVTQISVCDNPTAFGDFTGCATYNVYHAVSGSSGQSSAPTGGWDLTSMSLEIQQLLGKVKNGTVATSADLVTYHNTVYTTVESALDKLMDATPVISSFSATNLVYENGSSVTSLQLSWTFNKSMATAVVKAGGLSLGSLATTTGATVDSAGTKILSGFSLTANSAITLIATDDKGNSVSKSINLEFKDRFLYGAIASGAAVGQTVLAALSKSGLVGDPYGKYFKIDCADGMAPILAFPSDWKIDPSQIVFANGYTNDWTAQTVTYTNASGGSKSYDVYVLNTVLYGDAVAGVLQLL